jgi:hypothetical protein
MTKLLRRGLAYQRRVEERRQKLAARIAAIRDLNDTKPPRRHRRTLDESRSDYAAYVALVTALADALGLPRPVFDHETGQFQLDGPPPDKFNWPPASEKCAP